MLILRPMKIKLYKNDLPADLTFGDVVAIDTEAMGLNPHRDRLCVVQLSSGDGVAHLVQFDVDDSYDAPNLKKLLTNPKITKLFHFARFDVAMFLKYLGVDTAPLYCTKIASKLARTYTDRHGLKELCRDFLSVDLSKQQQSSDWGSSELSEDQQKYAASDVMYLHSIKEKLDEMLEREGRTELAKNCFAFIPTRVALDLGGWDEPDIFQH